MRSVLAAVVLALAACGGKPPETLRLVTLAGAEPPGVSLRELPSTVLDSIGLAYGLAVVDAGLAGERAGLRIGDVVYGVDRKPVGSLEEFSRLVAGRGSGAIGLLVRRGKTDFYVAMDLGAPRGSRPFGAPSRDTLLRT